MNENQKLSGERKRRIERRMKIDGKMKTIIKKSKTEKRINDAIKQGETELVKIKKANNPTKLQYQLKELNKKQIVDLKLHEVKIDILKTQITDFEMVGILVYVHNLRNAHNRFRNFTDFEQFFKQLIKIMILKQQFLTVIFMKQLHHNLII